MLTEKQVIDIARVKLPLVVEAFTRANLEAQKSNASCSKLQDLMRGDGIDGFYDVADLLQAVDKLKDNR